MVRDGRGETDGAPGADARPLGVPSPRRPGAHEPDLREPVELSAEVRGAAEGQGTDALRPDPRRLPARQPGARLPGARGTRLDETAAREAVLAAADRLYYRRGIQSVGMDELRAEAGVPLKRLYQLFESKDAIVAEVLRRRHEMWENGLSGLVSAAPTPRARLLAVYDYLARWFDDRDFNGCIFINSFGELGSASATVATMVRAHKNGFQEYVQGLVRDVGGTAELAAQLAILAEGAQTTAAIAGTSDAARHARSAAETLIDAAGVRRA